jgi:hypothetical protein
VEGEDCGLLPILQPEVAGDAAVVQIGCPASGSRDARSATPGCSAGGTRARPRSTRRRWRSAGPRAGSPSGCG